MAHCVQEMLHNEPFLIMNYMFYAANYWDYFSFAIFKKKCLFIKWIIIRLWRFTKSITAFFFHFEIKYVKWVYFFWYFREGLYSKIIIMNYYFDGIVKKVIWSTIYNGSLFITSLKYRDYRLSCWWMKYKMTGTL